MQSAEKHVEATRMHCFSIYVSHKGLIANGLRLEQPDFHTARAIFQDYLVISGFRQSEQGVGGYGAPGAKRTDNCDRAPRT